MTVPENTHVGRSVFTLTASDDDLGANARLSYSLTPTAVSPRVLDVDPDSGNVFVVGRLDFESSDVEQEFHARTNSPFSTNGNFRFETRVSGGSGAVLSVLCQNSQLVNTSGCYVSA